jgi:hypothetical protein
MQRSVRRLGLRASVVLVTICATTLIPVVLAGAATPPGAPQGVRAAEVAGLVEVRWSPPASNGGASVRRYVATAHPSNVTCVTTTTSCVVSHLTLGASYSFTVVAQNAAGTGAPSAPSGRFRVPSAKAIFLSAATAFNNQSTSGQEAITQVLDEDGSAAQLGKAISTLQVAYSDLTRTLGDDKWPVIARADIASYITDSKDVSADWRGAYSLETSDPGAVLDTLQTDLNKQTLADAKVRTDLGLPQLITGPIVASTPVTTIPLGTASLVHDFSGDALSVTATQIIDPATAGEGSGLPDAGFRFVAVVLSLSNPGGPGIDGNANYSTTLEGSDGQTYTADFGSASECTNFTSGTGIIDLPDGNSATGCVLFQLPTTVGVQSVDFSLAWNYLDKVIWEN